MTEFRVVPDSLREREPLRRGRVPKNKLSRALLNGQTIFVAGKTKHGSIYTLARNHGMTAHTKLTDLNGEIGSLVWFEINRDV